MAAWSELLAELNNQDDPNWLDQKLKSQLVDISKHRGDAAVIFYASAFLQKQNASAVSITREDINGFMNALYEATTDNGLVLILHTPGGVRWSWFVGQSKGKLKVYSDWFLALDERTLPMARDDVKGIVGSSVGALVKCRSVMTGRPFRSIQFT